MKVLMWELQLQLLVFYSIWELMAIVMIVCVVMPLAWYNQRVTRKTEMEMRT